MVFLDDKPGWVPASRSVVPPGQTDNFKSKSPLLKLSHFTEPTKINTTSQYASKTVTNYWVRRRENPCMPDPVQSVVAQPDVRQTVAYIMNRDLAERDSVKFGHENVDDKTLPAPSIEIEHLCDENDNHRTRGIPGYTGKQPLPHQKRPLKVEEMVDPSRLYGKGGSSERKHWTKGIPGYTGHQPNLDDPRLSSGEGRYGVFMTVDSLGNSEDVGARTMLDQLRIPMDGVESVSSPVSGLSNSSHRRLKAPPATNSPNDIARRKIEEALEFGDKKVEHDGSTATLAMARKFHIAPERPDTHCPRLPVDKPKQGPYHEGSGAWKSTKTWKPASEPNCEFDWFMERPMPIDKRPEGEQHPRFWKEMSGLILHEGEHAGLPVLPYNSVKHMRGIGAYGAVQNAVPTGVSKERLVVP